MNQEEDEARPFRVRFYGVDDLATGYHAHRVSEIALAFDVNSPPEALTDVLELHNVGQYIQHGVFEGAAVPDKRDQILARLPQILATVGRYFGTLDAEHFASVVKGVEPEFHSDFLDLLGRGGFFNRCSGHAALAALDAASFHLADFLRNKALVVAYDLELRNRLLSYRFAGELVVRKYLEKDARDDTIIPKSFTQTDGRRVIEDYINDDLANLNYVRLIANAPDIPAAGIDAKLRLRAKRRSDELTAELFKQGTGIRSGVEVAVSEDLQEPVLEEIDNSDGWTQRLTYSAKWLTHTLDYPSVLNNFQHLFAFVDHEVILNLPSYPSAFGFMDRFAGVTGKTEYKVGSAFRIIDSASLLQTQMYSRWLDSRGVELEDVIRWFCDTYLVEEFGAKNFSFVPSASASGYLHKVRHLFAEMESLANQYTSYVENGELDRELLAIGSDQVRYRTIPSLVAGKYLSSTSSEEIAQVLHLLFSDQSSLCYIDETLKSESAARLIQLNEVAYESFHEYQRRDLDYLLRSGILANTGRRLTFASVEQLYLLLQLNKVQSASYYHLSPRGRIQADEMIEKGWLSRNSSLLTEAEGDYFNYILNRVSFSNGPNLRNLYQHGSQGGADDSDHYGAYLTALRMAVALVLKINDDLRLKYENRGDGAG
jgi:hypothetical protein